MGVTNLQDRRREKGLKTMMVVFAGKCFIGDPEYTEVLDETTGKPTGEFILTALKKAYEFFTVQVPAQTKDALTGQVSFGIRVDLFGTKVGDLTDLPESIVGIELASDSPYYIEYVRLSTGVQLAGPKMH